MKKLMSIMLGLAFLAGTGSLGFAQDNPPKKEKKKKSGKKKKAEKKESQR